MQTLPQGKGASVMGSRAMGPGQLSLAHFFVAACTLRASALHSWLDALGRSFMGLQSSPQRRTRSAHVGRLSGLLLFRPIVLVRKSSVPRPYPVAVASGSQHGFCIVGPCCARWAPPALSSRAPPRKMSSFAGTVDSQHVLCRVWLLRVTCGAAGTFRSAHTAHQFRDIITA